VPTPPPSPSSHSSFDSLRAEPRDVVELRRLRASAPHLSSAVDFELGVLAAQRSIVSRVQVPRLFRQESLLAERLAACLRLVEFADLTIDWSDVRRLLREGAELLARFGLVEVTDLTTLVRIARDGEAAHRLLRQWYDEPVEGREGVRVAEAELDNASRQACVVALRPYLTRCADTLLSRVDLTSWNRPMCPLCAGEPEFAVWASRERRLVCGRCRGQWPFPEPGCPFCHSTRTDSHKSFASRSRIYRITACDDCQRYLKGFDESRAARPMLYSVDAIATLPLDAAALQLGYR
jgi:Protein involved in formate dehydrogenase formation